MRVRWSVVVRRRLTQRMATFFVWPGPHSSRTLSGKTRKNIMCLASTTYRTAMADEFHPLVDRNPFLGGARGITDQDNTERAHLTVEQVQALHAAPRPAYRLLFVF
jgi:hypothetical protein